MSWALRIRMLGLAFMAGALVLTMQAFGASPAPGRPSRAMAAMGLAPANENPSPTARVRLASAPTAGESAERVVRFDIPANMRSQLSNADLDEQLRDWLLFGVVQEQIQDSTALRNVLFDLPPVRYGHMEAVSTFEFGPTRARYIGEGAAVALVPAAADRALRIDHLAHVADAIRRDLGEPFVTLSVYEYSLDAEQGEARLRRLPPVSFTTLFSPAYGYRERRIADQASLGAFLRETDDLVMVQVDTGTLVLGGRKRQSGRALGVALEDLAVLASGRGTGSGEQLGFSLDPTFNYPAMVTALDRFERIHWPLDAGGAAVVHELCPDMGPAEGLTGLALSPGRTSARNISQEVRDARTAMSAGNAVPLLRLVDALGRGGAPDFRARILDCMTRTGQFQRARYDGNLQGTEVGMTLFYTDLISKLWVINYAGQAPLAQVPGFTTDYSSELEAIYREESRQLPYARLWFGPASEGYGLGRDRRSLLFGRLATRLYSAGSNPLEPGREIQTSRRMDASTHWWNDHYEAVADYEPQYQRLNQIMKWSLALSWLNAQPSGRASLPLDNINVRRDRWFPDWASARRDLRFASWSGIEFRRGNNEHQTETLPLLRTEGRNPFGSGRSAIEGGVSLASREQVARLAVPASDLAPTARRAFADYTASDTHMLSLGRGASFAFDDGASVLSRAADATRRRSVGVELTNGNVGRVFRNEGPNSSIGVTFADRNLGVLRRASTPNGFRIGYEDQLVERAYQLARRASHEDFARLADAPDVATMINAGESRFVRMNGSNRWVEFAPDDLGQAALAEGWTGRAAQYGAGRAVRFRFVEDAQVARLLGGRTLGFRRTEFGTTRLDVVDAPAGRPLQAVIDGRPVPVSVSDDAVYVRVADVPADLRADSARLSELLDGEDVARIRQAPASAGRVDLARPGGSAARVFREALDDGDAAALARAAADNPSLATQILTRGYRARLGRVQELIRRRDFDAALAELNDIERAFGPTADVVLRRAMVRLEQGRLIDLTELSAGSGRLHDGSLLLDEVTARLRAASGARQEGYERLQIAITDELRPHPPGAPRVRPFAESNDRIGLRFTFLEGRAPAAQVEDLVRDLRAGGRLYVEDSPRFAQLDWSQPLDRVLLPMVGARRARLEMLPVGDASSFRPSILYGTRSGRNYRPVVPLVGGVAVGGQASGPSCRDSQPSCTAAGRGPVYVLVAA